MGQTVESNRTFPLVANLTSCNVQCLFFVLPSSREIKKKNQTFKLQFSFKSVEQKIKKILKCLIKSMSD